ncbi:MAG: phosphate ABC transporter substrate-binding protein PstS [Geminicoccaceae bacterium]
MDRRTVLTGALAGAAAVALPRVARAADISGAGATFPYPIYAKWAAAYKDKTGIGLNYQAIGSGGGIKQITARTVVFGASDQPLDGKKLAEITCTQFPMVMGGVVPVMNLPDITPGQLVLDGPTLADLYMGNIANWNDAKIQALNPDAKLPDLAVAPVYRSDGSGTTYNFTNYLAAVSEPFKSAIGVASSVKWPSGIGGKGNDGVANMVTQTQGGLGYVEYAYVKQNKMTYARMVNTAGKVVEPGAESFQAAAANADWANSDHFAVLLGNQPGDKSWPITAATFILFPTDPKDPAIAKSALDFFAWAYAEGDEMALALDYVPMPDEVVKLAKDSWSAIKGPDGAALWSA